VGWWQYGITPLHAATEFNNPEVVKLLVEAKADKNAPSNVSQGRVGGGAAEDRM